MFNTQHDCPSKSMVALQWEQYMELTTKKYALRVTITHNHLKTVLFALKVLVGNMTVASSTKSVETRDSPPQSGHSKGCNIQLSSTILKRCLYSICKTLFLFSSNSYGIFLCDLHKNLL